MSQSAALVLHWNLRVYQGVQLAQSEQHIELAKVLVQHLKLAGDD